MAVLGIDPGETTGYAIVAFNNGKPTAVNHGIVPVTGYSEKVIITQTYDFILSLLQENKVDIEGVGIEAAINVPKFTNYLTNDVRSVCKLAVAKAGLGWYMMPLSTVKKRVAGNGKAKKEDIQRAVKEILGIPTKTVDIADAYAIAIATLDELPDL